MEDLVKDALAMVVVDLEHVVASEVLLQGLALDVEQHRAVLHILMVDAGLDHSEEL